MSRAVILRQSRRIAMLLIALAVCTAGAWISAAPPASAVMNPDAVLTTHEGWVLVNPAQTATGQRSWAYAYYWNGTDWDLTFRWGGTRVYAFPFNNGGTSSGGWIWTWDNQYGWLLMRTYELRRGYSCTGPNCPVF